MGDSIDPKKQQDKGDEALQKEAALDVLLSKITAIIFYYCLSHLMAEIPLFIQYKVDESAAAEVAPFFFVIAFVSIFLFTKNVLDTIILLFAYFMKDQK